MSRVVIIGAGGVGSVVAHKCAQMSEVFSEVMLASRTLSRCEEVADSVLRRTGKKLAVRQIDADDVAATAALLKEYQPELLLNLALPYQDLHLMDACLEAGVHYLDTANYEPRD